MLHTFTRWFQAPIFPEDEDKTRRALLLNVVLNTVFFAMPVLFVGVILGGRVPRFERILVVIVGAWLTTLGTRFIMLAGRVALAGVVAVIIIFISATLAIYNIGTIRAPVTSFYILATVTAGLTINRRAVMWTAVISAISVITLLLGEKNGYLPIPTLTVSITQAITFTVVFAIIAILLFLAVKSIDEALARVRLELSERVRAKEQEKNRREMMEKVIQLGKTVTEQTSDLRTALIRIWDCVHNGLDFDRTAIFIYNPDENIMQGSYGTNRSGDMSEEWHLKFGIDEGNSFFRIVLSQPDGYYFTQDYAGERNLHLRPGHPMGGVKYYAAVAVWAGDKPAAIICVDQLISGRIIADEQLEALRLFAGYAGLAIENTRLNSEIAEHAQEREKFIQELGNRNAELERFTYTVSHDLRSPIVTIKGFLGMLNRDILEDHRDRVTSDMQRIAGAADKMEALLSDLLELSRIGRIINPPDEIDLVKLAYETLETVDGRLRAKNIATHVSPDLPRIHGDRIRLSEVLENLIDNAAKYMGEQSNPLIEIGTRIDNGEQVIFVKDNGTGIEPQYLQKVFGLFEKLNPTSEGTGIGLALIKRIIEVHGGRIWAESEGLGKGSTFCFTIPDGRMEGK
jgi:signal transduction histidine kinase